jgi:septal ring factor EnvC (AmiA/AmiB activator)
MAAKNLQNLTDGELEIKQTTAKVKRLGKKKANLQAQLDTLNAIQAAAIAPLQDDLNDAKARLAAINARSAAFEAKCAARMAKTA